MTPLSDTATVDVSDREIDGPHGPLTLRVYLPEASAGPGLVWAHGGGFAGGDLDMPEADGVARELAARGIVVVSVDYRRAPLPQVWAEATGASATGGVHYPVPSDEVAAAFHWAAAADPAAHLASGPWAIGGASAGGNLAAGATLRLIHDGGPVPALAVLAYPTLHAVQAAPDAELRAALDANPDADRFGPAAVLGMYENYLGGAVQNPEVFAVPGDASAEQLALFPPTIMINGDVDQLRVSGEAFARALSEAGREVDVSTEPGTMHGHLNRPDEPAASRSLDRFAARILALAPPASTPATEGMPS
ncbi:alpha/beta hydrolase fold domain-containing protein [Microbacterium sp. P03]|uniref:alpha/beta hydrolase fold domain-containing protein n=1 Tax=Microbacterium sp. P03 TaxID=3366946 RepID=UPI003745A0EB